MNRDMTQFVAGISVVCFAASYGVALACEASRPLFRSTIRGMAMLAFASAGVVAHALFLVWRAASEPQLPLSSGFDFFLVAAWVLAAGYLWLAVANPRTPVGLFLLPVVLGLIAAAQVSSREPFPQSPATQFWGIVHGGFNLVMSVSVALGGVAGAMWLIQAGRLSRKAAPAKGFRMPSLEKLAAACRRTGSIAAWTAAAGFLSGIVLNAVNRRLGLAETVRWDDPVVVRMGLVVAWLLAATIAARLAVRRPDGPRTIAWLAVVSAIAVAASILWGLAAPTRHGAPPVSGMHPREGKA